MDYNFELKDCMRKAGLDFIGEVNFSNTYKYQRFKLASGPKKDLRIWVRVHDTGEGASFGNWGDQDTALGHWFADGGTIKRISFAERIKQSRQMHAKILEQERQLKLDRKASYARCVFKIKNWTQAPADHPYLVAKKLSNDHVMWYGDELLFPMIDTTGTFKTFHRILMDGSKKLSWSLSPQGAMIPLSDTITNPIRVCEGWATGKAFQKAVGGTVMCAIPCGNVPAVTQALYDKFPNMDIILCPDNDQWKAKEIDPRTGKRKRNSGRYYAKIASKIGDFTIRYPTFDGLDVSSEPTDWHDLWMLAGIDEVKRQLLR